MKSVPEAWRPRVAALVIFVLTFALHAALLPAQGLTDDDDFYAPAGIRYAQWVGDVFSDPGRAFSRDGITAAFRINSEHPPLAKLLFGASHALFHDALGLSSSLDGARMGTALCAALTAAVLVLLLWRPLGLIAALAAPMLLLSLPRFFFHSQVATLDVPVACAVLAVTAAFFHADETCTARAARAAGVVFGLALLVKLNAPFALLPCLTLAVLSRWRGFRVENASLVIPPVPPSLLWMTLLGPTLFVALWPWLWFDTVERLGAYFAFHLKHYPIYMFYDGEIWERPFAPWHASFVHGVAAMPAPVVVLGILGAARGVRAVVRVGRAADSTGATPEVTSADKLRALVLLQATLSIALVANPTTPRYGGEKLFMPFFPLWCALAADGVQIVVDAARAFAPRLQAPALATAVVALATAPGAWASVEHHGGFALSYYGELVGGLRGAVARGLERTYYDVADKELARHLDADARDLTVHFEPNHKEYVRTYRWLQRDGVTSRIQLVNDRKSADLVVLTHERRWSTYAALALELEAWGTPVYERALDGVPLYTVYRRR